MDLFTVDNVGEAELLDRNTNENILVKFETKVDGLNNGQTQDGEENGEGEEEVEEEDENLSDVDFGGKCHFM